MSSQEVYAYGDWTVDGTECPITSAGLQEMDHADSLSVAYDNQVELQLGVEFAGKGIITKEQAIEVIENVLERYQEIAKTSDRNSEARLEKITMLKMILENELYTSDVIRQMKVPLTGVSEDGSFYGTITKDMRDEVDWDELLEESEEIEGEATIVFRK